MQFNIPILVVHAWIGFDYIFDAMSLDYRNFDEIVSYAEKYSIKIAFENTEGEEYLFALMSILKILILLASVGIRDMRCAIITHRTYCQNTATVLS